MFIARATSCFLDLAATNTSVAGFLAEAKPAPSSPKVAQAPVDTDVVVPRSAPLATTRTARWMGTAALDQVRTQMGGLVAEAFVKDLMTGEAKAVLARFGSGKHAPNPNILWVREYLSEGQRDFFDEVLLLTTRCYVDAGVAVPVPNDRFMWPVRQVRHKEFAAWDLKLRERLAALSVAFIKQNINPYDNITGQAFDNLANLGEAGFRGLAMLTQFDFGPTDRFYQQHERAYWRLLNPEFSERPGADIFKEVYVAGNLLGTRCVDLLNHGVPIENFVTKDTITNGIGGTLDKAPTPATLAALIKHVSDKTVQRAYNENAATNPLAANVLRYQVALHILAKSLHASRNKDVQVVFDELFAQGGLVARVVIAALVLEHRYDPAEVYLSRVNTPEEFIVIINHPGTRQRELSATKAATNKYNAALRAGEFAEMNRWWHIVAQLAPRSSLPLHTLFGSYKRRDHAVIVEKVDILIADLAQKYNVAQYNLRRQEMKFLWEQIVRLVPHSRLPLDTLFMERPKFKEVPPTVPGDCAA